MKILYPEIPLGRATDISQKQFGKLTALYRTNNLGKKTCWVCQCECGNIISTTADNLLRGHTQSCGCYQRERTSKSNSLQIEGQKFGKLTAIKRVEKPDRSKGDRCVYWLCKCDCGSFIITQAKYLKSGHTCSCGCIRSIGESIIQNILQNNNISFIKEYVFKDLAGETSHPYRFDFFLPDFNRLIEFDGKQHYSDTTWGSLDQSQQRDKIKNEYALKNNIPLVRIPYWERDNITLEMLLGDKYLIKE